MNSIPTPRAATLKSVRPMIKNVLLEKYDGLPVTVTAISRDCGPDGEWYCTIEAPFLPYPWNVSGQFLEGADLFDARNEAWKMGQYIPADNNS